MLPYLLPKGKFGFNAPGNILISAARYVNQRLLNFNQYFTSDSDYIFLPGLCLSSTTYVHQQTLLCTKLNQLHSQQEQLRVISKGQLKGLLQVTMHFHL